MKIDKIEKIEPPRRREVVDFELKRPARSGDDVVTLALAIEPAEPSRSARRS